MKSFRSILAVGAMGLGAIAFSGLAQTNLPSIQPVLQDRVGRVVVPEQPVAVDSTLLNVTDQRPYRPERPALSPEVKARIERFRSAARAYLEREEALRQELLAATDEERAKIREQLRLLRERWFELARERRKEFMERADELRRELQDRQEVIDSVREANRDQLREQLRDAPPRRGQD